MKFPARLLRRMLPFAASCFLGAIGAGCLGHINVLGRDVPDSEHHAFYDIQIAREKQGLEPEEHNEHGRIPSWDQFWCNVGGTSIMPPTAQSRRLRRYIIERRRAAGLRELSCGREGYDRNNYRSDHFYKPGDPRIFQ